MRKIYNLCFFLFLALIACKINHNNKQKQPDFSTVSPCDTFQNVLKRYWRYDSVQRYYKASYDFSLYEDNRHEPFKNCLYGLAYPEIIKYFGKPNDTNETSLFYYTSTDCYDRNSTTCHFMEIALDSLKRIYMIRDITAERRN